MDTLWQNTVRTLDSKISWMLQNGLDNKEIKYLDKYLNLNDDITIAIEVSKTNLLKLKKELMLSFTTNFDDYIIHMKFRIDKILNVTEEQKDHVKKQMSMYEKNNVKKDENNLEKKVNSKSSKEKESNISNNTTKYYNYSLKSLRWHSRFKWEKGKLEQKALLWSKREKTYNSISKHIWFLSWVEKETFTNILFFESVYWTYKDNKGQNSNWTTDIWPCAINNWATYEELKKAWIVNNKSDLYDWDTSFKCASYLMKRHWIHWFRKWYWWREAKKANLYA